jgi:hypothetical protein
MTTILASDVGVSGKPMTALDDSPIVPPRPANRPSHDRVVIVTDEQAWLDARGSDPTRVVPSTVPVYTWNLAGYRFGHGRSGGGARHTFGGLTDAGYGLIPLLEAGRDGDWPF